MRPTLVLLLGALLLHPPASRAGEMAERWFYKPDNLLVDANTDRVIALMHRASRAGYTHMLLSDSKFSRLGDMPPGYFRNVERVKSTARETGIEVVPAVFPIGYSNDLLSQDPNLIEALPVTNALFVIRNGMARSQSELPRPLRGGDFSDLKAWDWKDPSMVADQGAVRATDPGGANARITQRLALIPHRQYHLKIRVRTQAFTTAPEVKILSGNEALNFDHLGVKPTQDWRTHHVVFNSLSHTGAVLYVGAWGATTGSVWFDDVELEEAGLVNLVRRPGAPFVVTAPGSRVLVEGEDFEPVHDPGLGTHPYKGEYDVWHEPPAIRMKGHWPEGTPLRVSYYHGATVYDGQANICPSEPRTVELLQDQARRMHKAWGARGYMMSHDEIRVYNWCAACQARHLSAGRMLAENVRACIGILQAVNPGGRLYTWSDMFDPNHNAVAGPYYLVRGSYEGSWEGLPPEVTILQWNGGRKDRSLAFFAGRGHRQIIAGYYDAPVNEVRGWLEAAGRVRGVTGVMYTTWKSNYADLEAFARLITPH